MKKTCIRLLAALLAVCLLLTAAPLSGFAESGSEPETKEYAVGDLIQYGSYPQSRVTDTEIIAALDAAPKIWNSYNYYSGTGNECDGSMEPSDYMKYADILHEGKRYRAVTFSSYRPTFTGGVLSSDAGAEGHYNNGYICDEIYYFLYEPLTWRVLDPDSGLVLSERVIDSQAYQDKVYWEYNENDELNGWQDESYTVYVNRYETCSVNTWLNDRFYDTAFSSDQQTNIGVSVLDNSSDYTKYNYPDSYARVFLLSKSEVFDSRYGFPSEYSSDKIKEAVGTDYAKCQGLYTLSDDISARWWLRSHGSGFSPNAQIIAAVERYLVSQTFCWLTGVGIRPAFRFLDGNIIDETDISTVIGTFEAYTLNGGSENNAYINCITIEGTVYPVEKNTFSAEDAESFMMKRVIATLRNGVVSELCIDAGNIAVFTTERSLKIETGKTLLIGFSLIDQGATISEWKRMALTVSNKKVISLSDYETTEYGYYVEITGKAPGSTNLTVSDPKTGAHTILTLQVRDSYTSTVSYSIDNLPSFYPNNNRENKIKTNIYDLNGLFVNNYTCYKNGDKYRVSFDVYNKNFHIGAVDIYDKDKHWIGSAPIEAFENIDSLWDTGTEFYYLISDIANGKLITYEQHSYTKQTHIDIEVPEGGYFTISNNFSESPGTFIYNGIDIFFHAISLGLKIISFADNLTDINRLLTEEFKKDPTIREAIYQAFIDTAQDEIIDFTQNIANGNISYAYEKFTDFFKNLLNSAKLDWMHIFETLTGVGESALKSLMGPYGMVLESCFIFSRATSEYQQAQDIKSSKNKEYANIYTEVEEGFIQNNGVIVNTSGNVDADAVLQVFKITNKHEVEIILNDDDPLQHCELYNICFVKDDTLVQPNGKVTVMIPIPTGMQGDTCVVYRKEPDGAWTIIDAHVQGNYLVFETDHFSLYAVVGSETPLSIVSLPQKTDYNPGELLDTTGLTLLSGDKTVTQGFVCSPTVLTDNGPQTITVRYAYGKTTFTVNVNGEEAYLIGDVDNDGKVTAGDARLALRRSVVLETYAPGTREYLACDVDGDGKVTAADARLILRAAVGLETLSPASDNKAELLTLYKNALENAENAGYTAYTYYRLLDLQATGNSTVDNVIKSIAYNYMVGQSDSAPRTLEKGSIEAKNSLPTCTLTDISKIRSATSAMNGENTVITLVMEDEPSPVSTTSVIAQLSKTAPLLDRDLLPELNSIEQLKLSEDPEMTYRNFTVTAELTPDGRLVRLTLTAPEIDIVVRNAKLSTTTIEKGSAQIMREETYNSFTY